MGKKIMFDILNKVFELKLMGKSDREIETILIKDKIPEQELNVLRNQVLDIKKSR